MTKFVTKLPRRPDHLLSPPASALEAAWRMAVQPLDQAIIEVERRWGSIERLCRLVSPEIAAKFGSAWEKLQIEMTSADIRPKGEPAKSDVVAQKAGVVIRGLEAMERDAQERGAKPDGLVVWSVQHNGLEYVVCFHDTDVRKVAELRPGTQVWSIEELIRVATSKWEGHFIDAAKRVFPGATEGAIPKRSEKWNGTSDDVSDIGIDHAPIPFWKNAGTSEPVDENDW